MHCLASREVNPRKIKNAETPKRKKPGPTSHLEDRKGPLHLDLFLVNYHVSEDLCRMDEVVRELTKIEGQTGFLIVDKQGAIVRSGGTLENGKVEKCFICSYTQHSKSTKNEIFCSDILDQDLRKWPT